MLSTPKHRLGSKLAFSSRRSLSSSSSVKKVSGDAGYQKLVMNRYSRTITQPKTQGASQVRFRKSRVPPFIVFFSGEDPAPDTRLTSFSLVHHYVGHAVRHRGCKFR